MFKGRRSFLSSSLATLPLVGAVAKSAASGPQSLEQRLVAAFDALEIADTHEHLLDEKERCAQTIDFFRLIGHYALGDAISAGMTRDAVELMENKNASDVERWKALEPYWKFSQLTGYSQCLRTAIRDIYGFDEISAATIRPINDAIRARNQPGLYRNIFKERARIRFWVQDDRAATPTPADRDYFVTVREFDRFVIPQTPDDVHKLEKVTGVSITSLDGLKRALQKNFEEAVNAGIVGIKTIIAYSRDILFQEVDEPAAARDFDSLMRGGSPLPQGFRQFVDRPFRNLEDYMFHQVIQLVDAHHLPVQFHTGMNSTNFVSNTDPTHLTNLFFLYPQVRWDVFHIGYPYQEKLCVLAKCFANVFIDFSWMHIVSPEVCRRALSEYLETIPSNKILGFGGDFIYAELTYAHAKMARRAVAQVLAAKVGEGFCSESEALELGRRILYENAAALFFEKRPAPPQPLMPLVPLLI
jgi:uncharacterized protein